MSSSVINSVRLRVLRPGFVRLHPNPSISKICLGSTLFQMGQMNSSSKSMSTSTKCNSGAGNSYEEYEKLRKKANENPKQMTDSDWQNLLDKQTYYVTREKGTERPWSSWLNDEKDKGTFCCSSCHCPLFDSKTKFNSGTGWPSFYDSLKDNDGNDSVYIEVDKSLFMTREEVLCWRCDAHLGHVFNDGPPPTGKRYCMNGVSLMFKPDSPE